MPTVSWLSVAPVKGLALAQRDAVVLERYGVLENRRFYLVDDRGRFVNGMRDSVLFQVRADYDAARDTLSLRFPDGTTVDGAIDFGEPVETIFYRRRVTGRLVVGPWAAALSEFARKPLALVQTDVPGAAVDRSRGAVSLVSDESVDELTRRSGSEAPVDARRFRMLIGIRGCAPHEEDEWLGRNVRVGEAVVHLVEPVARCAITTKDPETGRRDFDTLRAIKAYRGLRAGKKIDFGVYADVEKPGRIRVGDPVEPL